MSDDRFRILHLSDLHFGANFHLADLRSNPRECALRLVDYIQDGLRAGGLTAASIRNSGRKRYFDLLVISGDLTNFGKPDGMIAAEHFIDVIRGRPGSDGADSPRWWYTPKILLIPGNHDLEFGDRPSPNGSGPPLFLNLPREERQKPFRETYQKICQQPNEASDWLGVLKIFTAERLTIFGFDSCRLECWQSPGMGVIGLDQLHIMMSDAHDEEMAQSDGQLSAGLPWVRLAFVHHHLDALQDRFILMEDLRQKKYGTFTLDAAAVEAQLAEDRVDFVLHGHLHERRSYTDRNQLKEFSRFLGVGSIGVSSAQCANMHHFYTLEIGPPAAGEPRSLTVQSFRYSMAQPSPGLWDVTNAESYILNCAHGGLAQDPYSLDRALERLLAIDAKRKVDAFEDYPRARLFFTRPDPANPKDLDRRDAQLSEVSRHFEANWNRLRQFDPGLPEWFRAMALLLRVSAEKGQQMLQKYEELLNSAQPLTLPDFFVQYLLYDEHQRLDRLRTA